MFGQPVQHFETVESTNDVAMQWARDGAPHGSLVRADSQTRGRGRQGRDWVSPPEMGLYVSLILRPAIEAARVPHLTMLAALAISQTVETMCGLPCHTKWPNDVILRNRKIGGVLSEAKNRDSSGETSSSVEFVVVGVGVNINFRVEDLPRNALIPASSLLVETGRAWSLDDFLSTHVAALQGLYERYEGGAWNELRMEFERRDVLQNRAVRVESGGPSYRGVAEGIDASGALIVRRESGARRVVAGDVTLDAAFDDVGN